MCEEGKRQSSFLCPRGTIFNQEYRVCDWWYNVKCEDSSEYFDLNLDLMLEDKRKSSERLTSNSLGLDLSSLVEAEGDLGPSLASKVDFGLLDLTSQLGLSPDTGNNQKSDKNNIWTFFYWESYRRQHRAKYLGYTPTDWTSFRCLPPFSFSE